MLIYEMKLEGTKEQYGRLDEAIRTGRFIRNSIIRAWIDREVKSRNEAYKYCKILADNPEFPWAKQLNSQARKSKRRKSMGCNRALLFKLQGKNSRKKGVSKVKKVSGQGVGGVQNFRLETVLRP